MQIWGYEGAARCHADVSALVLLLQQLLLPRSDGSFEAGAARARPPSPCGSSLALGWESALLWVPRLGQERLHRSIRLRLGVSPSLHPAAPWGGDSSKGWDCRGAALPECRARSISRFGTPPCLHLLFLALVRSSGTQPCSFGG